jgi:hypothetical protein
MQVLAVSGYRLDPSPPRHHLMPAVARSACINCCRSRTLDSNGVCRWCARYHGKTPPLPPTPTSLLPGTEAKILVMMWRVEQGYQPRHPDDTVSDERPNGPSRFCFRNDLGEPRIMRRLARSG